MLFRSAIDRALEKRSKAEGIAALDELAEKFLNEVEASGISGYRELGDRLDGKAVQAIAGVSDEPLTIQIVRYADPDPA